MKKLGRTGDYLSLVKFSHTVFAMPFALVGYFLGAIRPDHGFSLRTFLLMLACMVFARSAAMAFNRWADLRYDILNPRTAGREIPSGRISQGHALIFVVGSSVLFIIATALLNTMTLLLSPVALLIVLGYSYTKRFTWLCHLVLGLGLSLAPIGAYIAVTGTFALLPVLYSLLVLTWVSGFDIIYSLQDDQFDRETGLYSIPAVMSRRKALTVSTLLHAVTLLLAATAGIIGHGGVIYWAGVVIFAAMLTYQHLIVSPDDLSRVNLAFGTTNGIAGIIYGLAVVADLLL
ncbi:MAG: putative 4-hydroxybenzoate polyprenyltransferase [Bacteroidales bacterium]|nr:putative 4-hydroxybenzoate polyprenyltransferase [Bacteroidales bacterium]MDT8372574.1 UbiA-like polyprenyltransferase [Bacteroidales bacterium]